MIGKRVKFRVKFRDGTFEEHFGTIQDTVLCVHYNSRTNYTMYVIIDIEMNICVVDPSDLISILR